MSKAKKQRGKAVREGKLDPTVSRQLWTRKPQTQAVPNRRAQASKNACRGRWSA